MPATFESSAKIRLMRFASVIQVTRVMSALLIFTICSTFTLARWRISGTALARSSPRTEPDLYSVKLVDDAPLPAIVPPVESTQTRGRPVGASWAEHGGMHANAVMSEAAATVARRNLDKVRPIVLIADLA